MVEVRAVEL
jgi:hypothetical protein